MPRGARDAEQQPRPKEEGAGERDPACDTKKRGRSCALTDMLSSKAAIVTRQIASSTGHASVSTFTGSELEKTPVDRTRCAILIYKAS